MTFAMALKEYLEVCFITVLSGLGSPLSICELEPPEPVFSSLKWDC